MKHLEGIMTAVEVARVREERKRQKDEATIREQVPLIKKAVASLANDNAPNFVEVPFYIHNALGAELNEAGYKLERREATGDFGGRDFQPANTKISIK